jgi:hypothetical protein
MKTHAHYAGMCADIGFIKGTNCVSQIRRISYHSKEAIASKQDKGSFPFHSTPLVCNFFLLTDAFIEIG